MVTSLKANGEAVDDYEIKVDGSTLDTVSNFQYLGSILNEDVTSTSEIKRRLAIATGQLAKLNKIWNSKNIATGTKIRLMHSLVTSIALYGCETWTYNTYIEKRIEAFEMRCFRRLLGITWREH